ncbi:hypothetical protein NKH77_10835 [Streptomyces sp. M19]
MAQPRHGRPRRAGGPPRRQGVVGITPGAVTAAASIQAVGSAAAVYAAAERLSPGDFLLIGLHRPGPRFQYESRDDQRGYVALEWWPDDYAAIRWATARASSWCRRRATAPRAWTTPCTSAAPTGSRSGGATRSTRPTRRPARSWWGRCPAARHPRP